MSNANHTRLPSGNQISKSESRAISIYESMHSNRLWIGLFVIVGLAVVSITFNYLLGLWTASDDASALLLPGGYALLDGALIFLTLMLGIGIKSIWARVAALSWSAVLLVLSLWACLAFTLSVDSRHDYTAHQARAEYLARAVDQANTEIAIWGAKAAETTTHPTLYSQKLQGARMERDRYQSELDSARAGAVPPALVIFHKISGIFGVAESSIQLIVRVVWSAALILTPVICLSVVASEIAHTYRHQAHRTAPAAGGKSPEKIREQKHAPVDDLARYQQIKSQVRAGALAPTSRAIKATGVSNDIALDYLRKMCAEGDIKRTKTGYELKT